MTPAELLRPLGLEAYLAAFETNGIDAAVLPTLTDADLRELGVVKLGDRKKILAAIARLPGGATDPGPALGWSESWPTPVAVALREYAREEHPVARLWAACDAVEMALRLLVIAGVARQARDGVLPEKLAREMRDILETPTLGGWFVLAQALAKGGAPAELAWVVGPLRDLLYGPEKPGNPETSFLRLRNRLAHGGGLTRSEAARLLALWRERFEMAFEQGSFFAGWELLGREATGSWRLLRGPEGGRSEAPPVPSDAKADAVWLRRADQLTLLWPLAIFSPPSAESSALRSAEDKAQVYSRKEAVRLTYTPVGLEGMAQSESGEGALRAFERLFESRGVTEAGFKVAGCEADLRKDAAQMVGRQRELEQVRAAIQETPQGVLWLSGTAGMGKSFLMAKVAVTLLEEQAGTRTLVLAYRFRSGDQARCSRESLAQFVVERLQAAAVLKPFFEDKKDAKAADRLSNALGLIADDVRVILLLDGLDEVQRRDEKFTEEVALGVRVPRLVCCCAGRPEPAIEAAMRQLGGRTLFAEGLPPMGGDDIRGMLLEKIGPLRKKLLGNDREHGDAVVNPFIELVAKRAAGLPMYVKYVVGDVLANRYRVLDGDESLPDSLHAYHEELLRRLGVGDLQAVVTPLAATLACAYEPLTVEQLEAVFLHRKLIQQSGGRSLLERGLAALAAMVTAAPTPEGATGYALFHQSLRDYILASPQMTQAVGTSRDAWAELSDRAEVPESLGAYLVRNAVPHLLVVDRKAEAERLLLDLERLEQIDKAGVPWTSVYRWWMELGGEERARGYIVSANAALTNFFEEKTLHRCEIARRLAAEAVWLETACRLARIILEYCVLQLGEGHARTLEATGDLGVLLREMNYFNEADILCRRVLAERERILGAEHPDTLQSIHDLAGLMFKKCDYAKAEQLFGRAAAGREKVLGPERRETLASIHGLAVQLIQRCDYNGADLLLKKVILIMENNLGLEHPDTMMNMNSLGGMSLQRGDYPNAEKMLRRAMEGRENVLGAYHPDTLQSVYNWSVLLMEKNEHKEAEVNSRRALIGFERIFGPDHLETLMAVNNLGELLTRKNDLEGAEPLIRRAVYGYQKKLGDNAPDTLLSLRSLAVLLFRTGNITESEDLLRHVLAGYEKCFGSEHPETLLTIKNLGILLSTESRSTEALNLLRRYAGRSLKALDFIRYNLACYECLGGNLDEARRLIAEEIAAHPEEKTQALEDADLSPIHDFIRGLPEGPAAS